MVGAIFNTGPFNAAAAVYGADSDPQIFMPRQRFQFQLQLGINPSISIPGLDDLKAENFIFHRVQSVTLPDYQHNVVPVNQYNRIRYVTTRMTPTPFNVVFYDTRDNMFQNILESYNHHYFHGANLAPNQIFNYDALSEQSVNVYGTKVLTNANRYFFDFIRIRTRDTATAGREITCFNCTISSVNHDMVNYSDSNPVTYQVQFQPEQVNVVAVVIDSNGVASTSPTSNAIGQ
jgi:hypothetical protein